MGAVLQGISWNLKGFSTCVQKKNWRTRLHMPKEMCPQGFQDKGCQRCQIAKMRRLIAKIRRGGSRDGSGRGEIHQKTSPCITQICWLCFLAEANKALETDCPCRGGRGVNSIA